MIGNQDGRQKIDEHGDYYFWGRGGGGEIGVSLPSMKEHYEEDKRMHDVQFENSDQTNYKLYTHETTLVSPLQ